MKTLKTLLKTGLLALAVFLLNTVNLAAQSSKEEVQLKGILSSVNKKVYGLLKLSQRLRESQVQKTSIEKVRIISLGCPLVDDPQSLVPLPDELLQSQEFEILDYQNRYYQIETRDGQTGWVSESCTEKFLEDNNILNSLGISGGSEYNIVNTLAQDTYLRLSEDLAIAAKLKKNKIDKLATGSSEKLSLEEIYSKILNKKVIADKLFEKYFSQSISLATSDENFIDNFSIRGQLALGTSNFKKSFATSGQNINKSGNTDFKLQLKYRLDPQSSLTFDAGKRQESLQSVYSNGFAGLGFNRNTDKFQIGLKARFNNYDDQFRAINSYKRINLNANVKQELSEKVDMLYRYNLLNNTFENKVASNYARHAVEVKSRIKTDGLSYFEIGGNADFSNSDLSFFKYKRYKPQLLYYQRKTDGGSSRITLYTEIFDFGLTPLRSNNKYFIGINGSKPSEDNTHTKNSEASFLARKFPNNLKNDFYQLKLGKGRRIFGKGNKQLNSQLIARFFPENQDFSHADLHLDYQTNSTAYYSLTANVRYWFPGDQNFVTTDLYAKVGLKIKTFSISPTLGFHANTDLKADEFTLKSDKNNFRGGLEARGNVLIAKLIRWNFRAAYEYGLVYNATTQFNETTGEILYGMIQQRNPHSLQIQSDLSAQVFKKTEIFGSLRYFNYKTDITSQLSISPVISNDRLSAQLGVRFRHN